MQTEKLEAKDLIALFESLRYPNSSSDNIHTYRKQPKFILAHNEILRFSKKELEGTENLYEAAFSIRNPYLFSAFIKKGVFLNKLSKESKWLLSAVDTPSNDLYQFVYYIEDSSYYGRRNQKKTELSEHVLNFIKDLGNPEQLTILDKYLDEFGVKHSLKIMEYIVDKQDNKVPDLFDYVIAKLKSQGVDVSKNGFLNSYLPETDSYRNSTFFISSSYNKHIEKMLQLGFRFDEKNYSYEGYNLFVSVLKSGRRDLVDTMLPYLKDISPKEKTLEEHEAAMDTLKDIYPNTYANYQKAYLTLKLEANCQLNKVTEKKKPKI